MPCFGVKLMYDDDFNTIPIVLDYGDGKGAFTCFNDLDDAIDFVTKQIRLYFENL